MFKFCLWKKAIIKIQNSINETFHLHFELKWKITLYYPQHSKKTMLCSFTARPKLVIKTYHFNTNLYFDPSLYLVIFGGEFSKGTPPPPPQKKKTTIIEKSLFYLKHDLKNQIKTFFMAICYLKTCFQETAY